MPRDYRLVLRKPEVLPVGVWTEITPAAANIGISGYNNTTGGCCVDSNGVIYFTSGGYNTGTGAITQGHVWRSPDLGQNWAAVSPPECDQPIGVTVNPSNPLQLRAWDAVRGSGFGLWESFDGSATWAQNSAFQTAAFGLGTADTYHVTHEPGNWNHILATFHSYWSTGGYAGKNASGVLRSTDGGASWTAVPLPANIPAAWAFTGGYAIHMLYNPTLGIGHPGRWLFTTQGAGYWLTNDYGATWSQVSTTSMTHGGSRIEYDANGVLYCGSEFYPQRSTDNGATWSQISGGGLQFNYYFCVKRAGGKLWTLPFGGGLMMTSPDTDGLNWTAYDNTNFPNVEGSGGTFDMAVTPDGKCLITAQQGAGVRALRMAA